MTLFTLVFQIRMSFVKASFLSASRFAARYFTSAPPVFQRLFFTSEEAASIQYGPRRMKLRDLMGATLRFLQSDCEKFRVLWDWSVCISQLLTSDVMVRGYGSEMVLSDPDSAFWPASISGSC